MSVHMHKCKLNYAHSKSTTFFAHMFTKLTNAHLLQHTSSTLHNKCAM